MASRPSTATERASATAGSPSRPTRASTDAAMRSARRSAMCAAPAGVGSTPSADSAASSSWVSCGLPPDARWQAVAKPGAGSVWNRARTSASVPAALSGGKWTTRVVASASSAATSLDAAPSSKGRSATASTTGSPSRRPAR